MSTVVGTLSNPDGSAYQGTVRFTALSTPLAAGGKVIVGQTVSVDAADDGSFLVTLKTGKYKLQAGSQSFFIGVPDDDNEYNHLTLVTDGLNNFLIPSPAGSGSATPATTTAAGIVKIAESAGDPVVPLAASVYTKTAADALLAAKLDTSSAYTEAEVDALMVTKAPLDHSHGHGLPRLWVYEDSGYVYVRQGFDATYDIEYDVHLTHSVTNGQVNPNAVVLVPVAARIGDRSSLVTIGGLSDDGGPLFASGKNYVGGNHGHSVSKITKSAHGYTSGDVGKRWTDANGRTFCLAQVVSSSEFYLARQPHSYSTVNDWTDPNVVPPSGTLTALDGQGDVSSYSHAVVQIYPSIKNRTVKVIVDGRELQTNEITEAQCVEIREQYDVWNVNQAYDKFRSGGSWSDCDPWIRRCLTYRWLPWGQFTIDETLKILDDSFDTVEFQSDQFGQFNPITAPSGAGHSHLWYSVEDVNQMTVGLETRDWKTPQNIDSGLAGSWKFVHPTNSVSASVPPWLGVQWANNDGVTLTASNYLVGFAYAFDLTYWDDQAATRKNQLAQNSTLGAWRINNATNKSYPNAFCDAAAGGTAAGIVLRHRCHKSFFPPDASGLDAVWWVQSGNHWLLHTKFNGKNGNYTIALPTYLQGKTASAVISRNGSATFTPSTVVIAAAGTGYVVVKLQ